MKAWIEAIKRYWRNSERRDLVAEYAGCLIRQKEILARLGVLNSVSEAEAHAERLLNDWPDSRALVPQAEVVRRMAEEAVEHDYNNLHELDGFPEHRAPLFKWGKP